MCNFVGMCLVIIKQWLFMQAYSPYVAFAQQYISSAARI